MTIRKNSETVILLHGIFLTRWHMAPLAAFLHRQGYEVCNIGYPSTRYPIEELIEWLQQKIAPVSGQRVHFVGHSMGGLLIRGLLARSRPANLGRVVMLGTPNHGSEVADYLKSWWLYRKLYGPAGMQLGTEDMPHLSALLGTVDYDLGIIAGDRTWDPFFSRLLPKPHDGKVSVESTKLEGMKDHIVLPTTHTTLPWSRQVHRQVVNFLKEGVFIR